MLSQLNDRQIDLLRSSSLYHMFNSTPVAQDPRHSQIKARIEREYFQDKQSYQAAKDEIQDAMTALPEVDLITTSGSGLDHLFWAKLRHA